MGQLYKKNLEYQLILNFSSNKKMTKMNYSLITHSDVFCNTALLVLDQMAFSKLAHVNLSSPTCVSFHQGFLKDGMSGDKMVI